MGNENWLMSDEWPFFWNQIAPKSLWVFPFSTKKKTKHTKSLKLASSFFLVSAYDVCFCWLHSLSSDQDTNQIELQIFYSIIKDFTNWAN